MRKMGDNTNEKGEQAEEIDGENFSSSSSQTKEPNEGNEEVVLTPRRPEGYMTFFEHTQLLQQRMQEKDKKKSQKKSLCSRVYRPFFQMCLIKFIV
jgi:hypothetical protein